MLYALKNDGSSWRMIDDVEALSPDETAAYHQPEESKPLVTDRIAARRYEEEVKGIIFGELKLDTGRDSQALITGAALASVIDPAYTCNWKTPVGFVELTAESLIAIASAIRAHVQDCFDREAQLLVAVASGAFSETMMDEGWPA